MGTLEDSGRKRAKRRNLKKGILLAIQTAALLGAVVAIPNLPYALHKLGFLPTKSNGGTIARARRRLLQQGFLKSEKGLLHLTERGMLALGVVSASQDLGKKAKRWDGRWRVLIFDVPEYRKPVREKIRRTLISTGFLPLQKSVWVYPYDCEDFIVLLKADFRIGKDVLYMIVDELENDKWLRREFNLSRR